MVERGTDISHFPDMYRTKKEGNFPETLVLKLRKEYDVKYGENPHQAGAVYSYEEIAGQNARRMAELTDLVSVRADGKGKGGLSLTNTVDISRAMDALKFFSVPAVAIMKHHNVSGFAKQTDGMQSFANLYRSARECDRRSNFGGVVAFNVPLDMETTEAFFEVKGYFVDVVAAPEYEEGVLSRIQEKSRNVRVAQFSNLDKLPKFQGDDTYGLLSIKEMPGGRVGVQEIYLTKIRSADDLISDPMIIDKDGVKHVVERDPTAREADDLITAWYLNITAGRSNCLIFMRNGILVANFAGGTERVGSAELGIIKGMQKAFDREGISYAPLFGITGYEQLKDNPFEGSSCASDGYTPFPDTIDTIASVGVSAILQPYGSGKSHLSIDAVNEYQMAGPATPEERGFCHF